MPCHRLEITMEHNCATSYDRLSFIVATGFGGLQLYMRLLFIIVDPIHYLLILYCEFLV